MAQHTPGRIAYEEDVRRRPTYDNGNSRAAWNALPDYAKWSWEKNATPREWPQARAAIARARGEG